jgi:hypothetical protein
MHRIQHYRAMHVCNERRARDWHPSVPAAACGDDAQTVTDSHRRSGIDGMMDKLNCVALESSPPSDTYLLHSLSPIVPADQCPSHGWRVKRIHRSKTQWPQVQNRLDIMYGPAAPQGTRIKLEVGYAAAQSRH